MEQTEVRTASFTDIKTQLYVGKVRDVNSANEANKRLKGLLKCQPSAHFVLILEVIHRFHDFYKHTKHTLLEGPCLHKHTEQWQLS